MHTQVTRLAILSLTVLLAGLASAEAPESYTWKYYRPGNTGVMGDYSTALWIDPGGTLYLGGFHPQFEEGGFSKFIESENRWENYSNVDYPEIGDTEDTYGSPRISDMVPDANGALWMGTARGLLYFDPAVGPSSLTRYDNTNSPLPLAGTSDVDIAPDGSIWVASYSNGGLARFVPATGEWTTWGFGPGANGWPGRTLCESATVQPKPGGGYIVWVDDTFGIVSFDSDTQMFTEHANTGQPGDITWVCRNDGTDPDGNTWMMRETPATQHPSLDYRRPDGTWVTPPQPPFAFYALYAFRAMDGGRVIAIGGNSEAWYFDGTSWSNLGSWRPGGFTYAVDMDEVGNVWVSGNGGAAKRDAETATWQRYRVTNTSMMDNFLRDIAFAPNGDVWVTENAGPSVGGIGVFDGLRWHNHNILTYGLGEEWPFNTDNADAITFRESSGTVAFNPMFNGIREWDGSDYITHEEGSTSDGLVEDSMGRLWTMGNYFSLRYLDETGFHPVEIAGWGANVLRDPDRAGTVWGCANLEVVRTDGDYYFSREVPDFPELNTLHDVLTTVAVDRDGVAWVGSTEGLIRVDANDGTHQWWHSSNSDMPGDQVTPLVVSPDGLVWFTNFNSQGTVASLVWFDGTEFGTITRAQGLPHAQIYDAEVRAIEGGYEIWLACASRGIAVLTVPTDSPVAVGESSPVTPLQLAQNIPNPLRSLTSMTYSVGVSGAVRLSIFDVRGRLVRTVVDGPRAAGSHLATWDARDERGRQVRNGVYFYRLETPEGVNQRKMIVAR